MSTNRLAFWHHYTPLARSFPSINKYKVRDFSQVIKNHWSVAAANRKILWSQKKKHGKPTHIVKIIITRATYERRHQVDWMHGAGEEKLSKSLFISLRGMWQIQPLALVKMKDHAAAEIGNIYECIYERASMLSLSRYTSRLFGIRLYFCQPPVRNNGGDGRVWKKCERWFFCFKCFWTRIIKPLLLQSKIEKGYKYL